jgi:hypothetical protein
MRVKVDQRGTKITASEFSDTHGYTAPKPNGTGPRSNPIGDFPTGPEIGERLPDVVALNKNGEAFERLLF